MSKLALILSLLILLPAAALAADQAVPEPDYHPAGDSALTIDLELDGFINGKMHKDRLMSFRGCTLERDAAYMYALMWEAAKEDGITLYTTDCYRTFHRQDIVYNLRCPSTGVPVYDTDPITGERWQVGTVAKRICSGPPTAKAGHSNHGWGRAIDFVRRNRQSLGCNSDEFHWLQSNSHRFGWVHPRWAWCEEETREPWHFEYAGVMDPTLVPFTTINETLLEFAE